MSNETFAPRANSAAAGFARDEVPLPAWRRLRHDGSRGLASAACDMGCAFPPPEEGFEEDEHEVVLRILRMLGVSEEPAGVDAEGLEHHLSDETLDAMRAFAPGSMATCAD